MKDKFIEKIERQILFWNFLRITIGVLVIVFLLLVVIGKFY
jgi:hypothetical protein